MSQYVTHSKHALVIPTTALSPQTVLLGRSSSLSHFSLFLHFSVNVLLCLVGLLFLTCTSRSPKDSEIKLRGFVNVGGRKIASSFSSSTYNVVFPSIMNADLKTYRDIRSTCHFATNRSHRNICTMLQSPHP
jgi:hypothetical protein